MDFQGIHDHLRAIRAPGLAGADEPRAPVPGEKHGQFKDPGRGGDPFVIVEPARIVDFLRVCRDDPRLAFELLIDLSATDPKADDPNRSNTDHDPSQHHRPTILATKLTGYGLCTPDRTSNEIREYLIAVRE